MINRHDFQQAARHFRSGRLSLSDFTERVFGPVAPDGQAAVEVAGYRFPQRKEDAHKGDLGRVLVVGGSVGMAGAAALTGQAALRAGSGLVQVITPADAQGQVAGFSACLMVLPAATEGGFFGEASVEQILQQCEWADVVALGPGMGRTPAGQQIACQLYEALPQPLVVDADGLNNLADARADLSVHRGERILTPHPGEFQRLIEQTEHDRQTLETLAVEWAARQQLTLVLKGHRSLVTDGRQQTHNPTGNSGMATAGCGDVLTGIIAALWGQGLSPWEASRTGCYLQGLAGDLAAGQAGKMSLVAVDLLTMLPAAALQVERGG